MVLNISDCQKINAVAPKRQIVRMKNRADDFFVLDQDKPLINGCCDSNLKLEIGTKGIIRKKRIGNTSIIERSLIFLSAC